MRAGLIVGLAGLLIGVSVMARALDLPLPQGAEKTADILRAADTIRLPVEPLKRDVPAMRRDGDIHSRAWRLPQRDHSTLQILSPLRAALEGAGWSVIFDCAAEECGGFDFRISMPSLPAPAMFVDLFDYRYLLATRGAGAGRQHVVLIVSGRGGRGYVQATHLRPATLPARQPPAARNGDAEAQAASAGALAGSLAETLRARGHAVLSDLDFTSGAARLGPGPHDSLAALAEMLRADTDLRIALVGHTDTVGGLDGNVALSRARTEAVRTYLIDNHAVPPARIEAHGIGYLAPRGPNDTAAGRDRNRRVEAIVIAD